MKKNFLTLFAVIAAASFTQASELQPKVTQSYTLTPERIEFMVQRLGTVVKEEVARSKAQPTSASTTADANAKSKSNGQVAIAKDAKKTAELAADHS